MTDVTVFLNSAGRYMGFECLGHAGYADKGEDIVCAGISVLTITAVNALEKLTDQRFHLDADGSSGHMLLRLEDEAGDEAQLLLSSMVLGLQEIRKDYGKKFIKLHFKEV